MKTTKKLLNFICSKEISVKKTQKLYRKVIDSYSDHIFKIPKSTKDIFVKNDNYNIQVRIFFPINNAKDDGAMIFIHGGGWARGNIDTYNAVCDKMSRVLRRRVFSIDYRLSPEHKFPTGLNDCYSVISHIFKNANKYNIDPSKICIIGDSAGGNLCAALSLMARELNEFKLQNQILIYPALFNDYTKTSPFKSVHEKGKGFILTSKKIREYMDLYIKNKDDLKNPYLAPLLEPDLSNLPRTLVITAQNDPLCDEGEEYAKRLKNANNKVFAYRINDVQHGYFEYTIFDEKINLTYAKIINFLYNI